jgi:hypothetical protein
MPFIVTNFTPNRYGFKLFAINSVKICLLCCILPNYILDKDGLSKKGVIIQNLFLTFITQISFTSKMCKVAATDMPRFYFGTLQARMSKRQRPRSETGSTLAETRTGDLPHPPMEQTSCASFLEKKVMPRTKYACTHARTHTHKLTLTNGNSFLTIGVLKLK